MIKMRKVLEQIYVYSTIGTIKSTINSACDYQRKHQEEAMGERVQVQGSRSPKEEEVENGFHDQMIELRESTGGKTAQV